MKSTRYALRLNSLTCITFGTVFLLFTPSVSTFLGSLPLLWLTIIGVGLNIHGIHLLLTSFKKTVTRFEVYYFSLGDIMWFLGSLLLIVGADFISNKLGVIATLAVAFMVASIGLLQLWTYSEASKSSVPETSTQRSGSDRDYLPHNLSRLTAISSSWMSLKVWIKYWLFALNGVFIMAIFFWPSPLSKITLVAYVSTLPLLLAILIVQRGLTRMLGIAHLIVWIPLTLYLVLRLIGNTLGPQISFAADSTLSIYTVTLLITVSICLAFDIYDLVQWFGGKRTRFGSVNDTINLKSRHGALGS